MDGGRYNYSVRANDSFALFYNLLQYKSSIIQKLACILTVLHVNYAA